MKKLIVLLLILIITPFLVTSEKAIIEEVIEISLENSQNPETANWEYVKARAFDENGKHEKGYDKPVMIILHKNTTYQDSIAVSNLIEKIKILLPSTQIAFGNVGIDTTKPHHFLSLGFGKNSFNYYNNLVKRNLRDGTIIFRSRPGFVTSPDGSKFTYLDFSFQENISNSSRQLYIEFELLRAIFSSNHIKETSESLFRAQVFNNMDDLFDYVYFGEFDKFLLQKVYADDFHEQFEDYLYTHYPWQYGYSFLSKEKMKMLAISIVTALGIFVFILLFNFFQNRKFKYSYFNYLFPMLLIGFHILNLSWIYKYLTDFNTFIGWDENISFGFIFIGFLGIISATLLYFLERLFIKTSFNFTFQLLLKIAFTFIALHLPLFISFYLLGENIALKDVQFLEVYFPWFIISIFLALGRGLLIYLNHISESLVNEKDVELSQLKEVNTQSELKLLQSHINPHFLYNALNSIAGLAYKSPEKTEKMALSLSNLFRYSINKKGQQLSTVKEEVQMVQNYLEIEKIRFGERLQFNLEVDESLENEEIPMYILQPLVENAIKHGISQIRGKGLLVLEIKKEDNNLLIRVIDNGPDFTNGLVSGHGLQTVYDLLRLSYGNKATLHWENEPVKHISIIIPK